MITFLLYLFETGLCLSILFLVYALFFSKETYFNFNRIYLISIIACSLVLPFIHISIHVSSNKLEEPISEIGKFRAYYSELIASTEPDFANNPYRKYQSAQFEGSELFENNTDLITSNKLEASGLENPEQSFLRSVSTAKIILLIYFAGVAFFLIRLLILTWSLFRIIKRNPKLKDKGHRLILLNNEIPPFSFFRYIFVNKEATTLKEFEQILAHEKVHVSQRHSIDLYLAHVLTVFQWFNPMVWQLQKAIKTTHEYIADSKVVKQGFELFDYQSLLLSQLISIRSVELVNNFNLLFIKKRIAMMTKNKSGFPAKLKALLIIPTALIIFFLFSNLTIKSPVFNYTNFGITKSVNFDGIWKNTQQGTFGSLLSFEGKQLSVLEKLDHVNVIDLDIEITKNQFIIMKHGKKQETLPYEFVGDKLKIWWTKTEASVYLKTEYANSFEVLIPDAYTDIQVPRMSESKILDQAKYIFNIWVYDDKYFVDRKRCSLATLSETIQKRVNQFNVLDKPYITTRLYVDKNTHMKAVYDLFQVLRQMKLYKVAYAVLPESNTSRLHYHLTAIPQKLPPTEADGAKMMDEKEVGDRLIKFSASDNLQKTRSRYREFMIQHPDYIAQFQWNNKTEYQDYLAFVNMTYSVAYGLRDTYALKKYDLKYSELPTKLQKELRKKYPLRITHNNVDEDFN